MRRLLVSILVALIAAVTLPISLAAAAPGGDTWVPRNAPQGAWTAVTFGDGLFVAVGDNIIMTSPDGVTWTPRTSPVDSAWSSVVYGAADDLFVAVASDGVIADQVMTSPDGVTWTKRTSAVASSWSSVTYGQGQFVAVASNGVVEDQVMTSPDGITWTKRTSAVDSAWSSVVYGAADDLFVAVASDGVIADQVMTSPDGITWTKRTSPVDSAWSSVVYGAADDLFVAVASDGPVEDQMMTSPDGITWTKRTSPEANQWRSVTHNGSQFVAVASSGSNRVMTSDNGIAWTARSAATASAWAAVAFGNGTFVAVDTNAVMSSTDGITWIDRAVATNSAWNALTWGEGVFVAVSNGGTFRAMSSLDAAAWTARAAPASDWRAVTWGNGMFVAVGLNAVMTSPDGVTWSAQSPAQDLVWSSVTYGNGLFVAVSENGADQVMTSPNGVNWTTRSAPDGLWRSVTYGNGRFVAISSNPTRVMTSEDGITWTGRTAAAENDWQSVTFGNNLFVAVSSNGAVGTRVMTSPDGITWTSRTAAAANTWRSVAFGNNTFVAVSSDGTDRVMFSGNGTSWTSRTAPGDNPWMSVAYGSGQFAAVANGGTTNRVMASGSFVFPPTITSFAPTFGPVGTTVVITGANLSGATAVVFDDTEATEFNVDSSNQITAKVPAGATTGRISVFNLGGTAVSAQDFVVSGDRIFGPDAIDTSIAISQAAFPTLGGGGTSASAVVLARSDFFSDALAGGPLAAQVNGPLLITPGAPAPGGNALDPRVLNEIERVIDDDEMVYILGGPLALSTNIDTTLTNAGFEVQRVFGQNQFSTAVEIAEEIGTPSAILEATGFNFPDALSAVPAAIQIDGVILLTMDNVQAPETQAYINLHPGLPRFAIGGPLVAAGADPGATPVFGQDLYDSSAAVATLWFANADVYGIATGATFPDALSGGVFMATGGRMGAVALVAPELPLPPAIAAYLGSLAPGTPGFVFGGPLAISNAVVDAVKAAVG